MKNVILLLFIISGMSSIMMAQGNIEFNKDPRLDKLMELYKDIETKNPTVPGYRVQIFSDGNRSEVQKMKDKFYAQFPDKKPFIIYQAPNFKLRIGNYRSRLEAYKDLVEITQVYNNAFVVKDDMNLSDL